MKTVYMVRCTGLGLITSELYAQPPTKEVLDAWLAKDIEAHGHLGVPLAVSVVTVPLFGDAAQLVDYQRPVAPAAPARMVFVASGAGTVT